MKQEISRADHIGLLYTIGNLRNALLSEIRPVGGTHSDHDGMRFVNHFSETYELSSIMDTQRKGKRFNGLEVR